MTGRSACEAFLDTFTAWAAHRRDIRGALVVGSRVRSVQPADDLADIDLLLITSRPNAYLLDTTWLGELGPVCFTVLPPPVVGHRKVRQAVFDGPVVVDFAVVGGWEASLLVPILRAFSRHPAALRLLPGTLPQQIASWSGIVHHGEPRILVDKGATARRFVSFRPPPPAPRFPTQAEFAEAVNGFWALCLWKSKQTARRELWMGAYVCDPLLKSALLQMLEWHARALHGPAHDTWYSGRFLERWADPRAAAGLPATFPAYREDETWRALLASMDLFSWLARETADRLGLTYPSPAEEHTREWIGGRQARAERSQ